MKRARWFEFFLFSSSPYYTLQQSESHIAIALQFTIQPECLYVLISNAKDRSTVVGTSKLIELKTLMYHKHNQNI